MRTAFFAAQAFNIMFMPVAEGDVIFSRFPIPKCEFLNATRAEITVVPF